MIDLHLKKITMLCLHRNQHDHAKKRAHIHTQRKVKIIRFFLSVSIFSLHFAIITTVFVAVLWVSCNPMPLSDDFSWWWSTVWMILDKKCSIRRNTEIRPKTLDTARALSSALFGCNGIKLTTIIYAQHVVCSKTADLYSQLKNSFTMCNFCLRQQNQAEKTSSANPENF